MDSTPPRREPTLIDAARAMTGQMPLPGPATTAVIAGRYVLQERIGTGGMSEVWRAQDQTLDRDVAVKLLHPGLATDDDARTRFASEARRAAQLAHPRVVRVLDAGQDGDEAWIVMELIQGPTLSARLGQPMAPDAVARIGIQVADALSAAHAVGMVHRDVKPSNILLAADGARLTDFGIARAAGEASMTATGQLVGTAAYLAPEQAQGLEVTPAVDVFALGCVLFEALTGHKRFTGDGPLQTALARIQAVTTVQDLGPTVPLALAEAVVRMLAEDPSDRPADGAAAAEVLRQAAPTGGQAPPVAIPRDAPSQSEMPSQPELPRQPEMPSPAEVAYPAAQPAMVGRSRGRDGGPLSDVSRMGALGVLIVLALLVTAVTLALSSDEGPSEADAQATAAADTGQTAPTVPVTLTSFDPEGGGSEHDSEVALLQDGDPQTRWTTERYTGADFGNLKSGVGILIDLGQTTQVAEVRLLGLNEGQDLQLRTAAAQPASIDDTTVVAEVGDAGSQIALTPPEAVSTQWLVVWITGELPAGDGGFRGAIGEIEIVTA
ncbi:MAG: protein kinase domain-containing protein [Euzebya sp.]